MNSMRHKGDITDLTRLESPVPPWFYIVISGVLLYSHFMANSWTRLVSALLLIPFATIFVGVSGLILNRSGIILSSLLSLAVMFAVLFSPSP